MKKFTKLFLSCAAVAAVTAAVATSAMAAGEITGGVTGDVTVPETGAVTITNLSVGETPDPNTQVTFLVFKGTADTDISADSVKGIDQGTAVQPTNNGLKSDVTVPESGQETYTVKVGYYKSGAFKVKSGTFKLGTPAGEEYTIGDVSGEGDVDSLDAAAILSFDAGYETPTEILNVGKAITIVDAGTSGFTATSTIMGDVSGEGDADSLDAAAILSFDAGYTTATDVLFAGKTVTASVAE